MSINVLIVQISVFFLKMACFCPSAIYYTIGTAQFQLIEYIFIGNNELYYDNNKYTNYAANNWAIEQRVETMFTINPNLLFLIRKKKHEESDNIFVCSRPMNSFRGIT